MQQLKLVWPSGPPISKQERQPFPCLDTFRPGKEKQLRCLLGDETHSVVWKTLHTGQLQPRRSDGIAPGIIGLPVSLPVPATSGGSESSTSRESAHSKSYNTYTVKNVASKCSCNACTFSKCIFSWRYNGLVLALLLLTVMMIVKLASWRQESPPIMS